MQQHHLVRDRAEFFGERKDTPPTVPIEHGHDDAHTTAYQRLYGRHECVIEKVSLINPNGVDTFVESVE